MRLLTCFLLATLLICVSVAMAVAAPTYEGWLKYADGEIVATANWQSPSTWIHWQVTEEAEAYLYCYEWNAPVKDLSHIIIEVSPSASCQDFWDVVLDHVSTIEGPKLYTSGPGNPGMPGPMWGLKIDEDPSATYAQVSFRSSRVPVWGNFYAKDGKSGGVDVVAWNAGFVGTGGTYDAQYNTELSNVNWQSDLFIARPDSRTNDEPNPPVPEWGSLALGILGLPGLAVLRMRKRG